MSAWWENRKSRIGMSPIAKEPPPFANGKPWWTSPPIAAPMPEHIEYVVNYKAQLLAQPQDTTRDALIAKVNVWLGAAKRRAHEEMQSPARADLQTTDGLIVAASSALQKMRGRIYGLGGVVTDDVKEIIDAVLGRADRIRRERTTAPVRIRRRT